MALHPQARAAIAAEEAEPSPFDPSFDIDASRREARESAAKDPREPVDHVEDVEADVLLAGIQIVEAARVHPRRLEDVGHARRAVALLGEQPHRGEADPVPGLGHGRQSVE